MALLCRGLLEEQPVLLQTLLGFQLNQVPLLVPVWRGKDSSSLSLLQKLLGTLPGRRCHLGPDRHCPGSCVQSAGTGRDL